MKLQLIFIGPPGSGKGTQAKRMSETYNFEHISTGELLRNEIKSRSKLGLEVEEKVQKGLYVSDEIVTELIRKNCNLEDQSYIFDGYPRTMSQLRVFTSEILQDGHYKAIYMDISTEILVDRLTQRRICSKCGAIYNLATSPPKKEGVCDVCGAINSLQQRKDDEAETVKERLKVYKDSVIEILDFFKENNSLITVDSTLDPDEVFKGIEKALEL